jgi:purine-binding chemotaxis protein CheW
MTDFELTEPDENAAATEFSAMLDAWLATDEHADAPPAVAAVPGEAEPPLAPQIPELAEAEAETGLSTMLDAWLTSDEPAGVALPAAAPDGAEQPAPPVAVLPGHDDDRAPQSLLDAVGALDGDRVDPGAMFIPETAAAPAHDDPRYVLFTVAGAHYAVHQDFVTELDRVPNITLVPNVPGWVRGITNRRGDILSVVDTRALLGVERLGAGSGRMLVVRLLDDSCSLGLLVDDVQQIVSRRADDVRAPGPGLDGPLAPFMTGLFEHEQRTVAVLNLDQLLRAPLLRQFDEPVDATHG